MLRGDSTGKKVVCQKSARLLLPGNGMKVLPRCAAEPGGLDVHQEGVWIHRPQSRAGLDDSFDHLEHDLNVPAFASQVRRPESSLPAEQCGYDRLIQGGIPADQT